MIRVLALNDDNHATYFTTEHGVKYYNSVEFINECLAKPHEVEYVVRGIYICDEFEGIDEEELGDRFDCVGEGKDYYIYNFNESFEKLWAVSLERWYL
jgi:hypothetical protein